ncbi:heavy metal sensor kinase [Bryocella elongata]|uniref:histidine kinase n=1 Tax=Bryocella elongata TaxID=863522 RepID=A0A1H6CGJ0_9BACT|nr:ATP-binding protein [Bryocella elongata]SEG72130.1 heavy metal sensor kinase [Bryocella elongata]
MPRRPLSISLRLTIWFGIILLAGWFLFGAAMWFTLKHTLTGERRQTLDRRLDRLQELLHRDAMQSPEDRYSDFHDFASATGNGLMEVFKTNGELYWPSPSSAAKSFPWPHVEQTSDEKFVHVTANGQPYWLMSRPYRIGATDVVLVAAAPESGNRLLLDRFWNGLVTSAPLLLIVAMAGGYWISRRALSPVDRITATARSIGIRNLSERLPVTSSSDELQRLTETCNDMLERLEHAVRRLKQFTADASHELRGPLSLTRLIAEVALRSPEVDATSRASFLEIAEESTRAANLLEELLELARADAEPLDISLEPVDLNLLVEEVCTMGRKLAAERGVAVQFVDTPREPTVVLGHAPSLRRMLWILVDNAIKYTPTAGDVRVTMHRKQQNAIVQVVDTGIGIAAADLPRVFDRFYRADPSRAEVEGVGLGLSIAKWIADRHRAEIHVESLEGKGSTFTLCFSTAPAAL